MPAIFLQFGVTMSGTFLSRRNLRKLAYPVGIAMTLFQLYFTTGFGVLSGTAMAAIFVSFGLALIFLLRPAVRFEREEDEPGALVVLDLCLVALSAACSVWICLHLDEVMERMRYIDPVPPEAIFLGICLVLLTLEGTRRTAGLPLSLIAGAFFLYFLGGEHLPRLLAHNGSSLADIVENMYLQSDGIYGVPIQTAYSVLFAFIMFGAFLERSNMSSIFMELACLLTKRSQGGPAKVAVIASALQGMISGSSVANTVGSGSFTIPMMKRTGYPPEFAGAVEAAASTGGQIMPPIMGAAFLMAQITGFDYSEVAIAAILPAFLYFAGIFLMVHFEAKKLNLRGLDKSEIPSFWKIFLEKGYLLLPLVVLVYSMMSGKTSSMSAVYAILTSIVVSMFRKDTRMSFSAFLDALEIGARSTISVAVACAIAGIIVGIVTLTGIGLKLASGLLALSGGIKILALFFTMLACIILGMGVPTTANYVIMATITAPIVVKLGVDLLAAHMFVFYFGIVADITPPVALAAYAGSAIAKSNPMKTGVTATRIAIAAFIVPYVFAFSPEMLLLGAPVHRAVQIAVTSFIGMYGVAAGMEGFMQTKLNWPQRLFCIACGLMLIDTGVLTDIVGITGIAVMTFLQRRAVRQTA